MAPGTVELNTSLIELNKQIAQEEQRGEGGYDFFQSHLSDQLIFRRANSNVVGKFGPEGFMEGLRNNPFAARVPEGINVNLLGDRALVTLVIVGTRKDDGSVHRYRNIRLFSRQGDQWILELWYNYEITGL